MKVQVLLLLLLSFLLVRQVEITMTSSTTTTTTATTHTYRIPISASAASMCSVIVGSPFDAIKVRMQTHSYNNTVACIQHTYTTEGIRGFFRGILPPLITVNIVKTISVSVYEGLRSTNYSYLSSGLIAGISTSVISSPLEMIRNQRILYDNSITTTNSNNSLLPKHKSSYSYFVHLLKVNQLYRGYSLHLLRESLGTGIYWNTYEQLHHLSIVSSDGTRKGGYKHAQFICGGLTGMISWLFVFPADLVKNVYQKQVFTDKSTVSITSCINTIYSNNGIRGFYNGLWPTMLRAFPIHGLNLVIYEYFLQLF